MKINENLNILNNDNNFYQATTLVKEYKDKIEGCDIISLGIGDVSFPVNKIVSKAMQDAAEKESTDLFVGYGNSYGIPALREAIRDNEYPDFSIDEIYVSHGTKSDCCDLLELFDKDALIGIPSPIYPIYENGCLSLSRKFELLKCDPDYIPIVPDKHFDVIYLCSPNNPTGINYTYNQLSKWVEYALKEKCVIIYDNVYFKFIKNGVKSIYEVDGAKRCAIELRSFSKHASFTGVRCSYYVIPDGLHEGINKLWRLRTINRFNGASYIAQCGALATFKKKVQKQLDKNIAQYKSNALYLKKSFKQLGYEVKGGEDAPYLWIKCKKDMNSWQTFSYFLNMIEIVVVPGIIFGQVGDDHFRVSALGNIKDIKKAVKRIKKYEKEHK